MDEVAEREAPSGSSWLLGTGSTSAERAVVAATAVAAVAVLCAAWVWGWGADAGPGAWSWWQALLAVVLAVDVVGGIAANATAATKRFYGGPLPPDTGRFGRLVHGHVPFTALHVHPIVVGALVPGRHWWWGVLWYAWALAGVVAVRRAPTLLQRPTAFGVCAVGVVVAPLIAAPVGFAWLPVALLLKLVTAHAVDEPAPRLA